jgi:hypothetical protein
MRMACREYIKNAMDMHPQKGGIHGVFILDAEKNTYCKKLHEFVEFPPKLWYNN